MSEYRYIAYEIFEDEEAANQKTKNINVLLGYPNLKTGTLTYRDLLKKYEADSWAGCVTNELVNACAEMSYEEKLPYYDESNLESFQWLKDNEWFKPMEEL